MVVVFKHGKYPEHNGGKIDWGNRWESCILGLNHRFEKMGQCFQDFYQQQTADLCISIMCIKQKCAYNYG